MEAPEALRILDRSLEEGTLNIAASSSLDDLERAQTSVMGRKAPFSEVQRSLGQLADEDRRVVGKRANEVREALHRAVAERREALESARESSLLEADTVDVTLPGRRPRHGSLHLMTIVERQITDIFSRMGYTVVEGPQVETDWYNFTALNIPEDHPARTEKDTFYMDTPGHPGLVLRTETSAMQIRTMEQQEPPVFIVSPGPVYRRETTDATHLPMFHQVEGLAVDERITFADLKGTLETFVHEMFGPDTKARFTPSFFPFVEPGAQVEVSCFNCGGRGCKTCGGAGWLELLGCGMVHPKVFENVGYDPERYTGFAFGMGIERIAMTRYQLPDIRLLVEGDVRFLEQFEAVS